MAHGADARAFFFVATSPAGTRKLGVRAAANDRDLARQLREDRLLLLRAWRLPGSVTPAQRRVGLKDEAALHSQLSTLLSRGVPLTEALEVASSVLSPRAQRLLKQVREEVASGASFAQALARVEAFDDVAVGVYSAAERTGALADAADRLAHSASRRLEITQKIVTMLIYPAIVLTMSLVAGAVMLLVVVPMIGSALEQLDVNLPWYTKALLSTSQAIRSDLVTTGLVLVAAVALAMTFRRQVAHALRSLLLRVGAAADLQRTAEEARLFAVLGAMTRSGVPLADALRVAADALSPGPLRDELRRLQKDLVEGGVLRDLLEKSRVLPLATRKLLIAADRAGDLDQAFEALAEDAGKALDSKADRLLALLEPALLIVLFLTVGLLAFAIMYPMITAASSGIQ
ncbi:MAG: type II secretion system F family protein [Planctomycetota bacterium]|nr:MAG: type II secretion system F family protein [Planctomycetota bacterium]